MESRRFFFVAQMARLFWMEKKGLLVGGFFHLTPQNFKDIHRCQVYIDFCISWLPTRKGRDPNQTPPLEKLNVGGWDLYMQISKVEENLQQTQGASQRTGGD